MYHKNHRKTRRLRWRKEFVLLCAIATLLLGFVGTTVAYLFTATDPVENTFTPATVSNDIEENFDSVEKTNVTVENTGEVPVYVRATYVAYWVDADGKVYPEAPVVTVDMGTENGWILRSDGIYYYSSVVPVGGSTNAFIDLIKVADDAAVPEGCHLVVDVMSDSIQATPTTAVTESWGVTLDADGNITG